MTIQEKALELHEKWNGKLETVSKTPVKSREDLSLAYTPGVAEPCKVIAKDKEAAYKYTIEGSTDGKSYKMLVDGRQNWQVGFLILNIEDPASYRYLRLRVYGVVNVHKGNSAMWADGIYEFAAFGTPQ